VNNDRLVSPKEVLNEINQNDDQLTKWAKKQKKMFKEPTEKQIQIVQEILRDYPSLIDIEKRFDADPWVIALAIELLSQKTLFKIKRIVVSEEKLRGNQVKIPFICSQKSIESIDIVTLFRTEGWKF
jgi:protein associated with RNAse G/E